MSATIELPPAQHREVSEENATTGWPPSLNDVTHARSSSPASRNSPGRVRLAKKAARVIYNGIPQHQNGGRHSRDSSLEPLPLHLQPCVEKSIEMPNDVQGDDGKKGGMSMSGLRRRLRNFGRSSGVKDASSWHQPLENGSDKGGKKLKGVAPPPPAYPPYNKYGRSSDVGSTHFVQQSYSRSSAPSPEERPQPLGGLGKDYDDEGYPIPRYPLARQTSSHATHNSSPPTKRRRLYPLTHRWMRRTDSNPSLTAPHTASTGSSQKSVVSKAFDALLARGRRSSEASGSSPSMESSQPSFQHIERASTSTKN